MSLDAPPLQQPLYASNQQQQQGSNMTTNDNLFGMPYSMDGLPASFFSDVVWGGH
jgi:hypothetical protein